MGPRLRRLLAVRGDRRFNPRERDGTEEQRHDEREQRECEQQRKTSAGVRPRPRQAGAAPPVLPITWKFHLLWNSG